MTRRVPLVDARLVSPTRRPIVARRDDSSSSSGGSRVRS